MKEPNLLHPGFTIRPARWEDAPRILAISAQIWEGDDYIPALLDGWLAAMARGDGEVLVAWSPEGGALVAFAHWFWMAPGYAWFEGLRADPALQGRGAGKALTRFMIERARALGAQRIGLSTYIDNSASLRIIETHGFVRRASFEFLNVAPGSPLTISPIRSPDVSEAPASEAAAYIAGSAWLAAAQGYLSAGWKFYPFALATGKALDHLPHLLGIHHGGELVALLCASGNSREPHVFAIDFLEGTAEAMRTLLAHALALRPPEMYAEISAPPGAPALAILHAAGFRSWHNDEADVYVYERDLAAEEP